MIEDSYDWRERKPTDSERRGANVADVVEEVHHNVDWMITRGNQEFEGCEKVEGAGAQKVASFYEEAGAAAAAARSRVLACTIEIS